MEAAEALKKPAVREPTVAQGFELQVEKRLQKRQVGKPAEEEKEKAPPFKSQPLPKKILEGVVVSSPWACTWPQTLIQIRCVWRGSFLLGHVRQIKESNIKKKAVSAGS